MSEDRGDGAAPPQDEDGHPEEELRGDETADGAASFPAPPPLAPRFATPPAVENPFRHRIEPHSNVKREHFPSFDQAIGAGTGSPSSSSSSKTNTPATSDVLNRSNASSAAASNASSLNMSIGARAALNEHLRHIAKFGLDESNSHSNSNSSTNSPLHHGGDSNNPHTKKPPKMITPPRNPLDAVWNDLLDHPDQEAGDNTNLSPASADSSYQSPPGLGRIDTIVSVSTGDAEGTEAIEMEVSPSNSMAANITSPGGQAHTPTNVHSPPLPRQQQQREQHNQTPTLLFPWDPHSQDDRSRSSKSTASYFNSSRVNELHTPERNQSRMSATALFESMGGSVVSGGGPSPPPQGVTLRHANYTPTSPSILEDSSLAADQSSLCMAEMFHALTIGAAAATEGGEEGVTPPPLDSSFTSFGMGAADLSRISGTIGSPDTSFLQQYPQQQALHQPHRLTTSPSMASHQRHQLFFPSWDEDSFHQHGDDGPFLDLPPPPPPPPSRSTSHLPKPGSDPDGRHQHHHHYDENTSWMSLPMHRLHHRSLSPPETRRPPLLRKQHSCPESHHRPEELWYVDNVGGGTTADGDEGALSMVAQKAGLLALAHEHQPIRRSNRNRQDHPPSPPPTDTLMDFFRDCGVTASFSAASHQEENDSQHSPPGFFGKEEVVGTTILQQSHQETSVDDISTIQNESSSEQKNTSSSSSSMQRKKAAVIASVARRQSGGQARAASASASVILNKSTLSSSSSSSRHDLDRRRYRTVVPSRVFLKEEPKEGFFPVQRDSFSADDRSTASSLQKQQEEQSSLALLQDSFEAAYQVSLEEELENEDDDAGDDQGQEDENGQAKDSF